MDTKSFLQLLWDWCWTHTGTDLFVWLWVNISIVCHAVTFLPFPLSVLFFFLFYFFLFSKCLLMFCSCFDLIFFQCLGAFWLVWDFESVPPNLCICSNPKRLISAVQLCAALWCLRNLWKVKSSPEIHHLKHCIQKPQCWYHGFSWPWDKCLI